MITNSLKVTSVEVIWNMGLDGLEQESNLDELFAEYTPVNNEMTDREKVLLEKDFIIESVLHGGSKYRIKVQNTELKPKGRGITAKDTPNKYIVTEKALEKLQQNYSWSSNF